MSSSVHRNTISLHDQKGHRKYLNQTERLRFLEATVLFRIDIQLFCKLLYYTGARIAEVHNLKVGHIDFTNGTVVFESLKKRKKGVFREIPIPNVLIEQLRMYILESVYQQNLEHTIWNFSLRSASRYVKNVMTKARIIGIQGSAKGLRHGFAVNAVNKAPLTMVKKWLGHSKLETTEIYLDVLGLEEREIAKKLW